MPSLRFHPIADAYRLLRGEEFERLKASIASGFDRKQRIKLLADGRIIDGRNRARALQALGHSPNDIRKNYCETVEPKDLLAFVLSLNSDRRHDTESQRALAAAKLSTLPPGRPSKNASGITQEEAAAKLGVSLGSVGEARAILKHVRLVTAVEDGKLTVSAACDLARLDVPAAERGALLAEALAANEPCAALVTIVRRAKQHATHKRIAAEARKHSLGGRRHAILLADPPWTFDRPDGNKNVHSVEDHYPTMSIDEMCAFRVDDGRLVSEVAHKDAALFLWTTDRHLWDGSAKAVVEAWGFEHRDGLVWVKDSIKVGSYARHQHEHLIIATRGSFPPPATHLRQSTVLRGKPWCNEHSAKPDAAYVWIEQSYPAVAPRLELFARKYREGWSGQGFEFPGDKVTEPPRPRTDDGLRRVSMKEANALLGGHYLGAVTYSPRYCLTDASRSAVAVFSDPIAHEFKRSFPGALELVRLYKSPSAKFHTSAFLASTVRWLRANTDCPVLLSYADPQAKNSKDGRAHHGGIYRATGFVLLGPSRSTDSWRLPNGNEISAAQCYRKFRTKSREKIQALNPNWTMLPGVPKILYCFPLRKRLSAIQKVLSQTRYAACPGDESGTPGESAVQPREAAPVR